MLPHMPEKIANKKNIMEKELNQIYVFYLWMFFPCFYNQVFQITLKSFDQSIH